MESIEMARNMEGHWQDPDTQLATMRQCMAVRTGVGLVGTLWLWVGCYNALDYFLVTFSYPQSAGWGVRNYFLVTFRTVPHDLPWGAGAGLEPGVRGGECFPPGELCAIRREGSSRTHTSGEKGQLLARKWESGR
jgi:hypothetical protein